MKPNLNDEFHKQVWHTLWQRRQNNDVIPVKSINTLNKSKSTPISLYYCQFRAVFFILRIFGRLQLQVPKNGKISSKLVSWQMLYCILTYCIQTYLVLLAAAKRVHLIVSEESNYDDLIFGLHVLTYMSIHFEVPFTFWYQCNKIADYINSWTTFQENWKNLFGKEMKLSLKTTSYAIVIITIPSVIAFLIFENYATLQDPWIYLIPHLCTLGASIVMLCLWYCTCIELGRLSRFMIAELSKNLELRPTSNFLRQWRYLWIDLTNLTSTLGRNFSTVIISIMVTYSATFLLGFFNSVTKLVDSDTSLRTLGYMAATTWSLSVMFIFCDGGHYATNHISESALDNLLKSRITSSPPPDIVSELDLLIKAVETNRPEISLGGFVTVNRSLFVSFASNAITYLIVLVQFRTK